ncbi:MAG TPA: hypothetical protein VHW44_11745 [Pseudonocardiaceae bacterium]|jgi:hypothetical protein|nr:hypothetical protein [Pseudonocardiaceae bacterium]
MSGVTEPTQFLTVAFGTPIDIGFLPEDPGQPIQDKLTIGWQPKLGTSYLPYDPAAEQVGGD